MRVRHLAVVLVGVVLAGLALWTFGLGASGKGPTLINPEDGTINVAVTQAGSGTWVPYLITVRNLGTQPFTGEVLLVNRPGLLPSAASVIQAGSLPSAPTLSGPSSAPPPDSAYEVSLQLDARHKRTVSFYAPSAYTHAEVFDELGNLVAGPVPVDAHGSYLLGLLSDSDALEQELGTVRIGDLPARATRFDDASFPRRPVYLSGLLTIVMAHFQSARLSPEQIHALRDFVGFGGSLVIAGGPDLGTVARALPPELVPLAPGGSTTVAGLGPVGELAGLTANPLGQVATGTLVPGARVVLASPEGTPLAVESRYGAGRVVELAFDPDGDAAVTARLGALAWSQAISRSNDRDPAHPPTGQTLLDTVTLPAGLFPTSSDAPLPPVWLVAGLLSVYLLLVAPVNYLVLSRLRRRPLFWVTAPLLAVLFAYFSYGLGQELQGGIRDREIQLAKLAPSGAISAVTYHGMVFPGRGDHRIGVQSQTLVAPLSMDYPAVTPACANCLLPVGGAQVGLEEHVLPEDASTVEERGVVYGSVRVVGTARTGSQPQSVTTHVTANGEHVTGTVANTGFRPLSAVRIFSHNAGTLRSAYLADSLPPGQLVAFDVNLGLANLTGTPGAPGSRPAPIGAGQLISGVLALQTLNRPGTVAVVGFSAPLSDGLTVDGSTPATQAFAAFSAVVPVEAAEGNVANLIATRLASSAGDPPSGFVDVYDLELPAVTKPLTIRWNPKIHEDLQIYDWSARGWVPAIGPFDQLGTYQTATIAPSQLHDGLIRVRVKEPSLSWGTSLSVRLAGDS